jgi:hypothetical protein
LAEAHAAAHASTAHIVDDICEKLSHLPGLGVEICAARHEICTINVLAPALAPKARSARASMTAFFAVRSVALHFASAANLRGAEELYCPIAAHIPSTLLYLICSCV